MMESVSTFILDFNNDCNNFYFWKKKGAIETSHCLLIAIAFIDHIVDGGEVGSVFVLASPRQLQFILENCVHSAHNLEYLCKTNVENREYGVKESTTKRMGKQQCRTVSWRNTVRWWCNNNSEKVRKPLELFVAFCFFFSSCECTRFLQMDKCCFDALESSESKTTTEKKMRGLCLHWAMLACIFMVCVCVRWRRTAQPKRLESDSHKHANKYTQYSVI